MNLCWHFRLSSSSSLQPWDFTSGPPPLEALHRVRIPVSSALSNHVPAGAYSHVMGSHLRVESGLEHDLVRVLDRYPDTRILVSQPAELTWPGSNRGRSHVPDLLSCDDRGQVTVWDARPERRQDAKFLEAADVTRNACRAVGWEYRVFAGLETVERLNLLWLHRFRRPPEWIASSQPVLDDALRGGDRSIAELRGLDAGDGRLVAVLWHLLWAGHFCIDLTTEFRLHSLVSLSRGSETL